MDITTRKAIAQTIQAQLGGRAFSMMTGAKQYTVLENGELRFRIPGTITRQRINMVKIGLDSMDLYTMEFWRVRGGKNPEMRMIVERGSIYSDDLRRIFTEVTGLETSMPRIRGINA